MGKQIAFCILALALCSAAGALADDASVVTGVDLGGINAALGLDITWSSMDWRGVAQDAEGDLVGYQIAVFPSATRAHEQLPHQFTAAVGPRTPAWDIGNELACWPTHMGFRRDNVTCWAYHKTEAEMRRLAAALDSILVGNRALAPRGEAVPPLRVSLKYPAELHRGETTLITYAAEGVESIYVGGDRRGTQPTQGQITFEVPSDVKPHGQYSKELWFASTSGVMAARKVTVRVLPAEDGGG